MAFYPNMIKYFILVSTIALQTCLSAKPTLIEPMRCKSDADCPPYCPKGASRKCLNPGVVGLCVCITGRNTAQEGGTDIDKKHARNCVIAREDSLDNCAAVCASESTRIIHPGIPRLCNTDGQVRCFCQITYDCHLKQCTEDFDCSDKSVEGAPGFLCEEGESPTCNSYNGNGACVCSKSLVTEGSGEGWSYSCRRNEPFCKARCKSNLGRGTGYLCTMNNDGFIDYVCACSDWIETKKVK